MNTLVTNQNVNRKYISNNFIFLRKTGHLMTQCMWRFLPETLKMELNARNGRQRVYLSIHRDEINENKNVHNRIEF